MYLCEKVHRIQCVSFATSSMVCVGNSKDETNKQIQTCETEALFKLIKQIKNQTQNQILISKLPTTNSKGTNNSMSMIPIYR